jgi:L-arabinose isomerase
MTTESESDLPLEIELRLAKWKIEIEAITKIEDLRKLYMTLAEEAAKKELGYQQFIHQIRHSETTCYDSLKSLEQECVNCQQRMLKLLFPDE